MPEGTVYIGKNMGSFSLSSSVRNDRANWARGVNEVALQHAMARGRKDEAIVHRCSFSAA
jgi:hypothetical protein